MGVVSSGFEKLDDNNQKQSDFLFLVYAFRLLTLYLNCDKMERFLKNEIAWSSINQLLLPLNKEYFILSKRLQLLSTQ